MSWQTKEGNPMVTGIPDVGSWVVLDGCVCKVIGVEDKNTVEVDELFHLRYQHVALDMIERYATDEEVNLERHRRLSSVISGSKSQLEYLQHELKSADGAYKDKLKAAIEIAKESIRAYEEAVNN